MEIFGNSSGVRGCFVNFNFNNSTMGARLSLPGGALTVKISPSQPYVVTGLTFGQKEKYHLVQCFDDTVHTYAFGHDPASSIVSVEVTGFIIEGGPHGRHRRRGSHSSLFTDTLEAYAASRLSQIPEYGYVYLGQAVLKGFLIGMSSSTIDPQFNLQRFTFDLLAVEVHEG